MRLTRHTDFAMRVLFHLGVNADRSVPISEIARTYRISHNHLVKVVHELVKDGFLVSTRGRSGGIALARPAAEIALGDVIRRTERDFSLVDCVGCAIAPVCALPRPLREATRAFFDVLDRYTLADILANSRGIDAFLSS